MRYTISWVEVVKEGVGSRGAWKKSKMTLKDEQGKEIENVSTFLEVMAGQELDGNIVKNEQYHSLEFMPSGKSSVTRKPDISKSVEKAQERNEKSIEKFQDNKELSIKVSSTMRDAVLLSIAEFGADGTQSLEELITKWRAWLWKEWDKPSENPIYPN